MRGQLTLRGMIIGVFGAIVITTSSMLIALKMSSLPWPIIFVSLLSMSLLKAMGHTSLKEINVTQTCMSAGAMVAGGLAFTMPGVWMMGMGDQVSWSQLLWVTMSGVILGLVLTAVLRLYFLELTPHPYPMGQACAQTLSEGDKGGKKSILMFAVMGVTALFTFLRDYLERIPSLLVSRRAAAFGSSAGIYLSPMLVGIGYIIGFLPVAVWFLGAVLSDFGVLYLGTEIKLWDSAGALDIKQSLGIGLMVGSGIGIVLKQAGGFIRRIFTHNQRKHDSLIRIMPVRVGVLLLVVSAFVLTLLCGLTPATSCVVILGCALTAILSAECVGMSGINPMEIFGIIVLLLARLLLGTSGVSAFYVAAAVAVSCGLCGDVMNDFKAGVLLDTNPRAQWVAEAIGGVVGALVSVGVLMVIVMAYGGGVFQTEDFPAAQASAVAAMVGGVSCPAAFITGLVASAVLYLLGLPVITLGLGVYLPFYMSATVFSGGLIRLIMDRISPRFEKEAWGTVIASGLLGGEGIAGVIIALILAVQAI